MLRRFWRSKRRNDSRMLLFGGRSDPNNICVRSVLYRSSSARLTTVFGVSSDRSVVAPMDTMIPSISWLHRVRNAGDERPETPCSCLCFLGSFIYLFEGIDVSAGVLVTGGTELLRVSDVFVANTGDTDKAVNHPAMLPPTLVSQLVQTFVPSPRLCLIRSRAAVRLSGNAFIGRGLHRV
jgi:hypothetical protein